MKDEKGLSLIVSSYFWLAFESLGMGNFLTNVTHKFVRADLNPFDTSNTFFTCHTI